MDADKYLPDKDLVERAPRLFWVGRTSAKVKIYDRVRVHSQYRDHTGRMLLNHIPPGTYLIIKEEDSPWNSKD